MGWFLSLEEGLHLFGEWSLPISVASALCVYGSYVIWGPKTKSRRERAILGLFVGFAAGHLPATVLLVMAALDPEYLQYLRHQRIQMGMGGALLFALVADHVVSRFREE